MTRTTSPAFPFLGFGLGYRPHFHDEVFAPGTSPVDWYEAITENFLAWTDGEFRRPFAQLERLRERFPVVLHGVSMSLGSADPINQNYLNRLKGLIDRIEPRWISDHLCWTGVDGVNAHDLLPLPYTESAARHVSNKLMEVQERLGRRILIENVSSYIDFSASEMPEWEFIRSIVQRSGCGVLLDVNNIFVSSVNHGFDPLDFLDAIPREAVGQIHIAGHRDKGTHLIDTHDRPIREEVWGLYRAAIARFGWVSSMIEWDDDFPEWSYLLSELEKLRRVGQEEASANGFTRTSEGILDPASVDGSAPERQRSRNQRLPPYPPQPAP